MLVLFTGKNCEVSQPLKDYATKRFQRVLKHQQRIVSVHFTLEVDHQNHRASVILMIPGHDVFADHNSHDMYTSIDLLVDKLIRILRDGKAKYEQVTG